MLPVRFGCHCPCAYAFMPDNRRKPKCPPVKNCDRVERNRPSGMDSIGDSILVDVIHHTDSDSTRIPLDSILADGIHCNARQMGIKADASQVRYCLEDAGTAWTRIPFDSRPCDSILDDGIHSNPRRWDSIRRRGGYGGYRLEDTGAARTLIPFESKPM